MSQTIEQTVDTLTKKIHHSANDNGESGAKFVEKETRPEAKKVSERCTKCKRVELALCVMKNRLELSTIYSKTIKRATADGHDLEFLHASDEKLKKLRQNYQRKNDSKPSWYDESLHILFRDLHHSETKKSCAEDATTQKLGRE